MSYVTPAQLSEASGATSAEVWTNEVWTNWEGQVVHGFPLRRFLGGSDRAGVFLSEYKAGNVADVAIKFVPAVESQADTQLERWRTAAALSHPNLLRLFDMGRCEHEGREYLFVVMECAEQTLAQVLARRALGPDEVRELLLPTLDALAFLHRRQLVHAQLKPSNFLAVGDQLKLASDSIRPPGVAEMGLVTHSPYDPPELRDRGVSTAGDVWSLGVTLVEAFTQRTETNAVPASIPAPFANSIQRCLSVSPGIRPTILDLESQYNPATVRLTPEPPTPKAQPPKPEASPRVETPAASANRPVADQQPNAPWKDALTALLSAALKRPRLLLVPVALLVLVALWIGWDSPGAPQAELQPTVVPTPPVAPPVEVQPEEPVAAPVTNTTDTSSVLVEVTPDVPSKISNKIQGRIFVTVRVLVDTSGDVIGVAMESPGPSKYFARLSEQAARDWKFVPADKPATRVWLVRFKYTRDGITTRVTPV